MSLRFAYVTNGLADHRLEDALRLLADCGYDGVALTLDHVHFDPFAANLPARAARLRRLMGALGQDSGFAIAEAQYGAQGAGATVTTLEPALFPKQPS